ncbi:unnamed protein product [Polarella glacialis]|uniref:Uncharacterized protein n=1 Tax=Polarella glacialis TaxID=89957 RepID=A0A813GYV9_POLGL|nr:unnamed protein product [Polarella glacialis]
MVSHLALTARRSILWLLLLPCPAATQDPSCWGEGFTAELCCAPEYGPEGNPLCWDGSHTSERCCGSPSVHSKQPSDCFSARGLLATQCCDPIVHSIWGAHSTEGNSHCWDASEELTFERCCQGGWSPEVAAPGVRSLLPAPVLGEGCWDFHLGYDYHICCGTAQIGHFQEICWGGDFTWEKCCIGAHPIPKVYYDVPVDDPMAQCVHTVMQAGVSTSLAPQASHLPRANHRLFYVSSVIFRHIELESSHDFWWEHVWQLGESVGVGRGNFASVTRPRHLNYLGSLELPASCSNDDWVAGWFGPNFRPDFPVVTLGALRVNATHARLSPLTALRRPYRDFEHSWISARDGTHIRKDSSALFEFVVTQHRSIWSIHLNSRNQTLLLALLLPVLLCSLAVGLGMRGTRLMEAFALQCNLLRLGSARPPHYDMFRILTTVAITAVHVVDHYPFPKPEENNFYKLLGFV